MVKKEVLIVFFVLFLVSFSFVVLASVTGYTVTGGINLSNGSMANHAEITLHSTVNSTSCNCSAGAVDYSS
ncbi:hypothetical protein KJ891_00135, partial [Candidatus Micrarchaeota archaeon]|nr:hypothetical protein [Candidatus Micrarchaeota archaeon]